MGILDKIKRRLIIIYCATVCKILGHDWHDDVLCWRCFEVSDNVITLLKQELQKEEDR